MEGFLFSYADTQIILFRIYEIGNVIGEKRIR